MSTPEPLHAARLELQRVATHLLARARFQSDGRFGLRVTPGGIGTPLFGSPATVLRITGSILVRESEIEGAPRTEQMSIDGHSMTELARFAHVDLQVPFAAGSDTPVLGSTEAPLVLEERKAAEVMAWHALGAEALDLVLPLVEEPSIAQLWPEHFDIAFDALTAHGRVNVGASPGDFSSPEPYLYVAPWEGDRPGDPTFWNAPFGAVMTKSEGIDSAQSAASFFERGLRALAE